MDREIQEQFDAQAELQRQGIEAQQGVYAPQMFEQVQQAQAVLVEQTNPRKIVETIILRLQGKKKNSQGDEVPISKFSRPKLNEKGIEKMAFILDSHINQNVILSHLDEQEIGRIMGSLSDDLVDNLALNWRDYGIKDKTDLDDVNNSILINVFLALKRAEGQNEKNWLGKISIEQISGMPRFPKIKKSTFLDKFRL